MKYTAEEVRKSADWLYQWERKAGARNARAMLIAYAERIEADEEVEPTEAVLNKAVEVFLSVAPEWDDYLVKDGMRAALLAVWPNPPAQAAQVDRDAYEGAREDLLDWKGRAQRAEAALRSLGYAGVDASQAPAAQGEASLGRCKACGRATRTVCDGLDGNGLGCTNAPSIDLAAIREGIAELREQPFMDMDGDKRGALADKLEAAIKGVAP